MNLEFPIGARRVKAILLGGAFANAVPRSRRNQARQPEAARAAAFTASSAVRRRLAPFAQEISQ